MLSLKRYTPRELVELQARGKAGLLKLAAVAFGGLMVHYAKKN